MEHQPKHTSSNSTKQRCQHRFANRKRCMMSTLHQDPLCPAHAKLQRVEETATELTANLTTFKSAEELNDFLSRLLLLLAQNKISPRRAAVLAYITNQLLRTVAVIHQRNAEAQAALKAADEKEVRRIVIDMERPNHDDPDPTPEYLRPA